MSLNRMERWMFVVALGMASLALAVAPVTTRAWRWLQEILGPAHHRLTLTCLGVVGASLAWSLRPRPRVMVWWLGGLVVMGLVLQETVALEAERLHVIQYGLLGAFSFLAMPRTWSTVRRWLWIGGYTLALGAIEELIQWWLPTRVGAWQDVLLDGLGGLVGCYVLLPWSSRDVLSRDLCRGEVSS